MENPKVYTGADFEATRPASTQQHSKPAKVAPKKPRIEEDQISPADRFWSARPGGNLVDEAIGKVPQKAPIRAKIKLGKAKQDEISPVDKFLLARPGGKTPEGRGKKLRDSKTL